MSNQPTDPPPTPRNRGGRPALAAGDKLATPVNVRLPSREYDRAHARAQRDATTLPAIVRKALSSFLDEDEDADEDG